MTLDGLILALLYLVCAYALFWVGKRVFDVLHPAFRVTTELVDNDNVALALALVGYYLGLVLTIGGVLSGPSHGLVEDMVDILLYGPLGIVLLNLSTLVSDKLILFQFDNEREIIHDQNAGTGISEAGVYTATGLILFGALSGETGTIWTALAFWGLGQLGLILTGLVYEWITPYSIHTEIERDNVAVGVSFAGALIAMGNILGFAASEEFFSWQRNVLAFGSYALVGLVFLPAVRFATDKLLLPGTSISAKLVEQDHPHLGVACLEMFSYVSASFLIIWCV
ncbi:MAG: DUF350 domain-containing protein [Desulfurellaceae bacterium]|nr:DUF350 domain-containing protein [Desulfurellaceae bacterium]